MGHYSVKMTVEYVNGIELLDGEERFNRRTKYVVDDNGVYRPIEVMTAARRVFGSGFQLSERSKKIEMYVDYVETMTAKYDFSARYQPDSDIKRDNLARSKRRAVNAINDIICANDFDTFVTLTLDGEKIDRHDYGAVIKRLNTFLDNRVRRHGLKYVGVPERHKDGAIHFHFLMNSEALNLVESGTYVHSAFKRPVKAATLKRHNIPLEEGKPVYNLADWTIGYTTAIMTYGSRGAVARYIGKYITKGTEKIGGRWYYNGGDLRKPKIQYDNVDFDGTENYTYSFECGGGAFKVTKFDDDGKEVIYCE